MKKEVDYNYAQLHAFQELIDFNFDCAFKKVELQKKSMESGVGNWGAILDKDGKIKKIYYLELLTDEEKKLLDIENIEIMKKLTNKNDQPKN